MNRRDAIRIGAPMGLAVFAGSAAEADGGAVLSWRSGVWVPVLRADVRNVNLRRYPGEVIRSAVPRLAPCPVRLGYRGQTVGRVTGWRFRGGWLEASAEVSSAALDMLRSGRKVVRPASVCRIDFEEWVWEAGEWDGEKWVRDGVWEAAYRVVEIQSVEEVALLDPDDVAWKDIGGPI